MRYREGRAQGLDLEHDDNEDNERPDPRDRPSVMRHEPQIVFHRFDNIYVGEVDGCAVVVGVVLPAGVNGRGQRREPYVVGWSWIAGHPIENDPRPAKFVVRPPRPMPPPSPPRSALAREVRRARTREIVANIERVLGTPGMDAKVRAGTYVVPDRLPPVDWWHGKPPPPPSQQRCRLCHRVGHNMRWCPDLPRGRRERRVALAARQQMLERQHEESPNPYRPGSSTWQLAMRFVEHMATIRARKASSHD